MQTGRFEDEGWRIRKDGTAFWANVVISPVHNAENRLLGFAKVTRDLTERRRNEELTKKNKELVAINNDLDNFVYTASHDLKSPISNLEGLLLALGEDLGTEKDKHQEILFMMESTVTTLKNVISDLADITNIQQGKDKVESVNFQAVLEDVRESMRDLIKTRNAEIIVEKQEFQKLFYSRKNLRSILYNLVSNAIKYADPHRHPQIRISTSITPTGEYLLSVADNGLGIPENQVNKIFNMFKRAHSHVEGSGIGLFLVKKMLENTGDRISVESLEGKGSVFNVYFKQDQSSY